MSRHDPRKIEDVKVLLKKGDNGESIESIEKTGTNVLVDTYTITLTDGTKYTFNVTNGKGITGIEKTGTSGLVDTYTITFNDNTTSTFTVTNGKSISSIEKTGTNVLVDTYTITLTDGTTSTFDVTNGRGITSIDKTATVGTTDTYTITYNDGTTSTFNVINADVASVYQNFATVESSNTASQSYAVGDFLVFGNRLCKVTNAISQGDTITVGTNVTYDNVGDELVDLKKSVSDGKSSVASAITAKGVTTASDATFATMSTNISNIPNNNTAIYSSLTANGRHDLGATHNYRYIDVSVPPVRPTTVYSVCFNASGSNPQVFYKRIDTNGAVSSGSANYSGTEIATCDGRIGITNGSCRTLVNGYVNGVWCGAGTYIFSGISYQNQAQYSFVFEV